MKKEEQPKIVYRFKNALYINLTNRCPNLCAFCIKTKWHMRFNGYNLNLEEKEPSPQQVLDALEKEMHQNPVQEIVFCGYGEPTMRLNEMLFIAKTIKDWEAQSKFPPVKIRLNTNGLGNMINNQDIVPLLKGVIDEVYVSLNAQDEETWKKIVRPAPGYEDGFSAVKEFILFCSQAGFQKVVASCVEKTGADTQAVCSLAQSLGAEFYLRSFLDEEN